MRNLISVSLILLISLASRAASDNLNCGEFIKADSERQNRPVQYGEFPSLVNIHYQDKGAEVICTGSILSYNRILTSIKCFPEDITADKVYISVGALDNNETTKQLVVLKNVTRFETKEKSHGSKKPVLHGIIILKLKKQLQFKFDQSNQEAVNSVCLDLNGWWPRYKVGEELVVAGWTTRSDRASRLDLEMADCTKNIFFYDETICTTHKERSYFKDLTEGSPLLKLNEEGNWSIIGIHSKQVNNLISDKEGDDDYPFATFIPLHKRSTLLWIQWHT